MWCLFCWACLLVMFCVCHAFLSVHFSHVVTCWEMAGLFWLSCVWCFLVFLSSSHAVSWVSSCTWLYWFLILSFIFTLNAIVVFPSKVIDWKPHFFPKSKSKEDHNSTKILRMTSKFELDLLFIMLYPFVNFECIPSKFDDWKQKLWQRRQWLRRK